MIDAFIHSAKANWISAKFLLKLTCENKPISQQDLDIINNYYTNINPNDEISIHRFIRSLSKHTEPGYDEEVVNFMSKKDLNNFLKEIKK